MKIEKVLLINLLAHEAPSFRKRAVLRAGLGYIAQALQDKGIEYKVVDLSLGYSVAALFKEIESFRPGLIGVSLLTYRYKDSYAIIEQIKERFKDIKIVCGGPHVTTFRKKVLEECPAVDFGVFGEGEETIAELCNAENLKIVKGLIFRDNGGIVENPSRPFISNLDTITFPRYENFELENYPLKRTAIQERVIPIVSSRGCPYDCIFCPVKTTIGQNFRCRSAENIAAEMLYWYNKGYRRFSFLDDNFTLIKDRVSKICAAIKQLGMEGLTLSLPNGIRADKVDFALLQEMYSAGFRFVGFGVEGGNNRILKILKKHESIENIERAVNDACRIGYYVDLYFIIGTPGETEEDIKDSIRLAAKYPVDNVFFFNLIPYPCTELFEWIGKNGRFIYPPEYYLNKVHSNMDKPVFETDDFKAADRQRMLILARKSVKDIKVKYYRDKLTERGIPAFIAQPLAVLYTRDAAQILLNDSKLLNKARNAAVGMLKGGKAR